MSFLTLSQLNNLYLKKQLYEKYIELDKGKFKQFHLKKTSIKNKKN